MVYSLLDSNCSLQDMQTLFNNASDGKRGGLVILRERLGDTRTLVSEISTGG